MRSADLIRGLETLLAGLRAMPPDDVVLPIIGQCHGSKDPREAFIAIFPMSLEDVADFGVPPALIKPPDGAQS